MSEESKIKEIKVVLIGEMGVGKTSIISQYIDKIFQVDLETSTVGTLSTKSFEYGDNKVLKLEIWDTAGQERYRALTKMFYKEADVAVLVYDITIQKSFEEIKNYWSKEIENNAPARIKKILCGNKCDLENEEVKEDDAREFAKEIDAKFYLTSARNNSGINDLFANIAKEFTGDENVKMKEGNEDDNGNGDTVDDEPKDKFGSMKIIKKQSVDTLAAKQGCCK